MILGIDPGSEKCGVAVIVADEAAPRMHAVIPRRELQSRVLVLTQTYAVTHIALGSGTQAHEAQAELMPLGVPITLVNEYGTTLAARARYYDANPPRGWRRLIPRGLLVPPVPIDDWAAVLIAERYLHERAAEAGP